MRKNHPLASVIVQNYNGREVLEKCLFSLGKVLYPNFEVIVFDAASSDGSVEMIKKEYKKVKLIESHDRVGFAEGNNIAYEHTKGKYIVLLNGDTEVEPDWLSELINFAEKTPQAAVFSSKVLFFDNKKIINSAGGICDMYGFSPLRGTFDKDIGQYDDPVPVFYAHGAAMLIRREVIEKIGFLDEDYFIYHEEFDFCWRAWLAGFEVYFVPQAVVYHKLSQRNFYAPEKRAKRQFLVKKNRISTLIKNHISIPVLLLSLSVNIFISMGEIFYYSFKGDFETPKGTIQAYFWNIKNFKNDWQKRKKIQKLVKVKESYILKRMKIYPVAFDILWGLLTKKYTLPL